MTQDEFKEFIQKSKLKKVLVADILGVPQWVITKWLAHETVLFPKQQKKLDDFCNDFYKNNDYMKSE